LLQQIAPIKDTLPLVTLAPDLEELLVRSNAKGAGLMLDQALAERILRRLADVTDSLAAQGRQPVVVVSASLRRLFAGFLKSHAVDAIVLAVSELPETRRIEIVATLGGAATPPASPVSQGDLG
jgi:flagellar biosynthesis protein FlhA